MVRSLLPLHWFGGFCGQISTYKCLKCPNLCFFLDIFLLSLHILLKLAWLAACQSCYVRCALIRGCTWWIGFPRPFTIRNSQIDSRHGLGLATGQNLFRSYRNSSKLILDAPPPRFWPPPKTKIRVFSRVHTKQKSIPPNWAREQAWTRADCAEVMQKLLEIN